ncbi:hypothetical protein OPQ81_007588 [Rhizoctonia solani]|nr:hypothetical protein OPQ81_007588 [Rhizoctonia solani]
MHKWKAKEDEQTKKEQISKCKAKASGKRSQLSASKQLKLKAMDTTNEVVIQISNDKRPSSSLINQLVTRKEASNVTTLAVRVQNKQIHLLCQQPATEQEKNHQLEMKILKLKYDLKLQAKVNAKLAEQARAVATIPTAATVPLALAAAPIALALAFIFSATNIDHMAQVLSTHV